MLDDALNLLKKINDNGFSAYIVGGFVRDYILGIKSSDIDICTNAKPMDLIKIFNNAKIPKEDYGAVTIYYKNVRYEITTFRREIKYVNNRKPEEIEYIDSLEEDILRRDFTINALCMDKEKNIIDIVNGSKDIDDSIIRSIGNSDLRFEEDALRILRAIRFATKLNFKIEENTLKSIKKNKHLLKNISYERKKEELDKIFASTNNKFGIKLLVDLDLDIELDIPKLRDINYSDSLIGIWTLLEVDSIYNFSNNEKETINGIRNALEIDNLDPYNLYKYGLYINSIAGSIKNISNDEITYQYNNLVINNRSDIDISSMDIINTLNKKPGNYINEIYTDIEKKILYKELNNSKSDLLKYIVDNYK